MIKLIRFANEGFQNYTHKIKIEGKGIEVTGCYVFVNKIIPKALKYDRQLLKTMKESFRNRNKDTKNIGYVLEDVYVYARMLDPTKLVYYVSTEGLSAGISVQHESFGGVDTTNMVRVQLKDFLENLKKYEQWEKGLKKIAKEHNIPICYFNSQHFFYEVIIDADCVKIENSILA